MELRHLIYFKTVAETLHFRKAAEKLFISQPPLSRQIKELEEELGTRLFERSNKQVRLTEAGSYLYARCTQLLDLLEETRHTLNQMAHTQVGTLHIGYVSSTYQENLIHVITALKEHYPMVKTRLYEVPSVEQVRALEQGRLDVGILRAPVQSAELEIVTLFADPFVLVVAESDEEPSPIFRLSDWARAPFIGFNQEYAPEYTRKVMELCQRSGFEPEVVHESNNVQSIIRMVLSRVGVALVPASVGLQYAGRGLRVHELGQPQIFTEVVLAFSRKRKSELVMEFVRRYQLELGSS